jgi:hypothetical protein
MATKKKPTVNETKPEPKGYSIHIGVNRVSKRHYGGWDGELRAPEADAISMQNLAKDAGFTKSVRFLSARAKRDAVMNKMLAYANLAEPGDLFFLSYSGHGGQVKDMNKDEFDRLDETWCLYDGQLLDDEIFWCLSKFKKGVRIVAMIDCCHSGTSLKAIQDKQVKDPYPRRKKKVVPTDVLIKTFEKNREFYLKKGKAGKLKNVSDKIEASVISISACQDDEVAYDGNKNSLFTEYLLKIWKKGAYKGSHKALHKEIKEMIPMGTPNYFQMGPKSASFTRSKPFTI